MLIKAKLKKVEPILDQLIRNSEPLVIKLALSMGENKFHRNLQSGEYLEAYLNEIIRIKKEFIDKKLQNAKLTIEIILSGLLNRYYFGDDNANNLDTTWLEHNRKYFEDNRLAAAGVDYKFIFWKDLLNTNLFLKADYDIENLVKTDLKFVEIITKLSNSYKHMCRVSDDNKIKSNAARNFLLEECKMFLVFGGIVTYPHPELNAAIKYVIENIPNYKYCDIYPKLYYIGYAVVPCKAKKNPTNVQLGKTSMDKNQQLLKKLANADTMSLFLDVMDMNYSVIDTDGNYIQQNNTMINSISGGLEYAEQIDKASWENCLEVMRCGKKCVIEEPFGGKTYISIKQPIMDGEKCLGIRILSFDITDRKKAEEYKKEKEKAEQTVKFLEVLAGSVAHELKTPLAAINLQLDLIKSNCHPTIRTTQVKEEEREKIFTVGMNLSKYLIRSASTMINLVLSKIKYLVLGEIDKSTFGYFTMIGEVFDAISDYPFLPGEKEKVHFDHKRSLNFQYYGDPVFTRHLLFNLIKNALKAIKIKEESMRVTRDQGKETDAETISKPKRVYFIGKPTFEKFKQKEKDFVGGIFIDIKPGKEYNELVFMDTGIGMPPEVIDKLFESYYSKDAAKEGTGLGLAFCKLIMETYGGDIFCRSKEGEFTEFVMRFPVVKPQKPKLKIDVEFEAI